jgi:uncharacterized protein YndB with AHSA1/START domain
MEERSVKHESFVIERAYTAAPERVFAAFSDPGKKRRWFAEGGHSHLQAFSSDFRVGGVEMARFKSADGRFIFQNDTVYRDIQPGRRVVFAYNMSVDEKCISSSLVTIELLAEGSGTKLIFTEQSAFFEGADGKQIREAGWQALVDQLTKALAN